MPVLLILILIVTAGGGSAAGISHAVRCEALRCRCPFPVRWAAGRSLNGHVVTNATFLRDASKVLPRTGNCSPFQKLAGWKKVTWRNGPPLAVALGAIGWAAGSAVVMAAAAVLACALAAWLAAGHTSAPGRLRRAVSVRLRRWAHRDRKQSMAMSLATITGTAPGTVEAGVKWNPRYADAQPGEEVARWVLPRGFKAVPGEKNLAQEVWSSRIGFELVFNWQLSVPEPVLVMSRARQMRPVVFLHEVLDKLDTLDDSRAGIGLNDQDGLSCWNWADENPHGAMNAGSRHGKTEINKCLVAQIIRKGGGVTYIDPKEISLQGMEDIPRLTLRNDPGDIPAMWEAIADFRHLMDGRRIERARLGAAAVAGWNRQMLVLEEVNQFSEQSDDFWEDLPEEEEGFLGTEMWKPRRAKKTPRVWRHVKAVAWQGAAFKMHVFVDGQDVQATVLKGVRNSLGMRLLGAYQPGQWKFLVGTTPIPPAPNHKGRFCLVRGGEQMWLQAILGDKDPDKSSAIWRDYAMGGQVAETVPLVTGSPAVTYHVDPSGQVSPVNEKSAKPVTGDPRGVLVGLADAVERGVTPGATLKALRMDRHRSDKDQLPDGLTFPEPGGYDGMQKELFWSAELAEFNAARRGARRLPEPPPESLRGYHREGRKPRWHSPH